MPLITSIQYHPSGDGWIINYTDGRVRTFQSTDLNQQQKSMTTAELEPIMNTKMNNVLNPDGMFGACHLTSVVPLQGKIIVSNDPIDPSDVWW